MLNFYLNVALIVLILTLHKLSILLEVCSTLGGYELNFPARLFLNDFFLNSYYLLWTSFFYIPALLTLLVVILSAYLFKTRQTSIPTFLLVWLVASSVFYENFNIGFYALPTEGEYFNILLINSINKFHPLLFYLTLTSMFAQWTLACGSGRKSYITNVGRLSPHRHLLRMLFVITFTLFLGSWWAIQEGSWGGWWNWDPSEVFGLLVMFIFIVNLHQDWTSPDTVANSYTALISAKTVVLVYFLIQLNFDLVSHNFGTRVDQFIDQSQSYLLVIIATLIGLSLTLGRNLRLFRDCSYFGTYTHWKSTNPLNFTAALVVLIVLSSFIILVNESSWRLMHLNIFNLAPNPSFYSTATLVTLYIRFWGPSNSNLITFFAMVESGLNLLIAFLQIRLGWVALVHYLLLLYLLGTSWEASNLIGAWLPDFTYNELNPVHTASGSVPSLANFTLEVVRLNVPLPNVAEPVVQATNILTSDDNHCFSHTLRASRLTQCLSAGGNYFDFSIMIADSKVTASLALGIYLLIEGFSLSNQRSNIVF